MDDVIQSGRRQLERLNAQMAEQNALYQRAKIEGDIEGQDIALQTWSDLENQAVNLQNSYYRQLAAQQATQPRPVTREQINKMELHEMTPEQRKWWFAQQSKHGQDSAAYDAGECFVRENPIRR